ncbi:C45 family autoproteolytic acyltransferase/hydolase [Granulicella paludicola]|uniref:C45 family autoproteolytic acyltransferase/hydolase n=1 Tax=Granulicella paludicola TaxID=474951 RepID=UPI0021DF88C7|nr:C45 family peptidase [Granulicella paludicola]
MRLAALALLAFSSIAAFAAPAPDSRLDGAYKFDEGGWTYVHLAGTPEQIGFQHGYLLTAQIEDNLHVFQLENKTTLHKDWAFFRDAGKTVLWPHLDPEYQAELQGIADGLKAHGSKLDVWDVVAMNGQLELTDYYLPWMLQKQKKPVPAGAKAPGKCSAFIATGSATKDGKIVIAHSNWSSYAEGERWNYIFDIVPSKGQHFLMDGAAGIITSQDDFGVNASGLMITETTLPQINVFDPNATPEFQRSRKAMQYATSIDEYAAIMRKGNNGGYANSWMIGDRKTNEIAYLELGLHHTPLTKKKDGYFVSANFVADPAIIKDDTSGFDPKNMSSSMNARHITAEQFMQKHYGKLDTALAEAYLSDHYDSFDKKIEAGKRSLCGHEETSSIGEPVWDNPPFAASGAVTGKVMDANMAEKMSFIARAGHPCGEDFFAAPYFVEHPQFAWQKPILHDMKAGPWTNFHAGEKASPIAVASR